MSHSQTEAERRLKMILFLGASVRSERRWAGTQWCYNLEDLSEQCGLLLVFVLRLPAHGPLEAEEIQRLGQDRLTFLGRFSERSVSFYLSRTVLREGRGGGVLSRSIRGT